MAHATRGFNTAFKGKVNVQVFPGLDVPPRRFGRIACRPEEEGRLTVIAESIQ